VFGCFGPKAEGAVQRPIAAEVSSIHSTKWGRWNCRCRCGGGLRWLLHFGVDRLHLFAAAGRPWSVTTAHALLPCQLLRCWSWPAVTQSLWAGGAGFAAWRLTTPTGLALNRRLARVFGASPHDGPAAVGIGPGPPQTDDRPICCASGLAQNPTRWLTRQSSSDGPPVQTVLLQQAQMDDASAEGLDFLAEELRGCWGPGGVYTQAAR